MTRNRSAQIPKTSVLKRDASVLTPIQPTLFVRFLAQIAQISTDDSADLCSDLSLPSSRFNTSEHRCTDRSKSNIYEKKKTKCLKCPQPKRRNTELSEQLENICASVLTPKFG